MIEANSPQESHAKLMMIMAVKTLQPPSEKGRCHYVVPVTLTTFPFFTFALAGCLQSFHPTHAQLSNRNGKFVFSGTFHIMWVKVGQGILLNRSIFLNKSDQLCINIT